MVRAKFKVIEKTETINYDMSSAPPIKITMEAERCDPFGKFTPSGKIEMVIRNDEAAEQFKVGKSYFVDFTPVE